MTAQQFKNLSIEEQKQEIEKCKSFEYFYNNYCKKEGMPEFSEEEWNDYVNYPHTKKMCGLLAQRIA